MKAMNQSSRIARCFNKIARASALAALSAAASCALIYDYDDYNVASGAAGGGQGQGGQGGQGGNDVPCTPDEPRDCYDGPQETLGVGPCVGGTQICKKDGTGYGPCEGQVMPAVELCGSDDTTDEDCDGTVNEADGCDCAADGFECYTGPQETKTVAPCMAGTAVCTAQGYTCQGEVTPKFDDCMTPGDEDCDASPALCEGKPGWAKHISGFGLQRVLGTAVDSKGNVVIAGIFENTINLGGSPLTSAGALDAFVAKYDKDGKHLWSRAFGSENEQVAHGVAVGSNDDVFLTGAFQNEIDFGSGKLTSAGQYDIFLVRLNALGNAVWSVRYGDSASQEALSVAVTSTNTAVVAGKFAGSMDLGDQTLTSAGGTDAFIASFTDGGTASYYWAHSYGGAGDQAAEGVAMDAAGNVILAGWFGGSIDFFDGSGNKFADGNDAFLVRYDESGTTEWFKIFTEGGDQIATNVAFDSSGVVVAGHFEGTTNFGGSDVSSNLGTIDTFIAKYDAGGVHLWDTKVSSPGLDQATGVALDSSGNVLVTGFIGGQATVPPPVHTIPFVDMRDAFLLKLTPLGQPMWARSSEASGTEGGSSVAAGDMNSAYWSGYFDGTIMFDSTSFTKVDFEDAFLVKIGQ